MFDATNFNSDKLEEYFNVVIDFVFDKFSKGLERSHVQPIRIDDDIVNETIGRTVDVGVGDAEDIDEYTLMLYKRIRLDKVESTHENATLLFDTELTNLKERITKQMVDYRKECKAMDMIAWLDNNGNKAYELEKKNNGKLLKVLMRVTHQSSSMCCNGGNW
jgi:hypothetical protein